MRVTGSLLLGLLAVGCGGPARDGGPKLTLTWHAAPGAEEYVIERAEAGAFRELARVPAPRTEVRASSRQGVSPPTPRQCGTPKP